VTLDREALELRRARRRRRSAAWRWVAAALLLICVFGVGLALGEAMHDNPKPGGEQTTQRTLRPLPIAPRTVTVTVPAGK
jgi:hypothetical protein